MKDLPLLLLSVELFVEVFVFELLMSIELFILSDVLLLLAIDSCSKLILFSLLHILIGVTGFNLSKVTDLASFSHRCTCIARWSILVFSGIFRNGCIDGNGY